MSIINSVENTHNLFVIYEPWLNRKQLKRPSTDFTQLIYLLCFSVGEGLETSNFWLKNHITKWGCGVWKTSHEGLMKVIVGWEKTGAHWLICSPLIVQTDQRSHYCVFIRVKTTIDLHCGRYRIQLIWSLNHICEYKIWTFCSPNFMEVKYRISEYPLRRSYSLYILLIIITCECFGTYLWINLLHK